MPPAPTVASHTVPKLPHADAVAPAPAKHAHQPGRPAALAQGHAPALAAGQTVAVALPLSRFA